MGGTPLKKIVGFFFGGGGDFLGGGYGQCTSGGTVTSCMGIANVSVSPEIISFAQVTIILVENLVLTYLLPTPVSAACFHFIFRVSGKLIVVPLSTVKEKLAREHSADVHYCDREKVKQEHGPTAAPDLGKTMQLF